MTAPDIKTISFAGAGNVAMHLAPSLVKAGYRIGRVISRHSASASALAETVGAKSSADLASLDQETDLLIIAIPDQAIPGFALTLKNAGNYNGLVAHTSGSQSLGAISQYFEKAGVFYPLQSFTRFSKPDISHVPFCIEGTSSGIAAQLAAVAGRLSADVRIIDSAQRAAIHLAAVFAGNFSNHMYAIAHCLLEAASVDANILIPLIRETANRITGSDPADLQTGPAIRGDRTTLDLHLKLLQEYPEWKEIYKIISENIPSFKEHYGSR